MQLAFNAGRFGFDLKEAVELASRKKISALEFPFEPFSCDGGDEGLSAAEQEELIEVANLSRVRGVSIVAIRLNFLLDVTSESSVNEWRQMMSRLSNVAAILACKKILFSLIKGKGLKLDNDEWTKAVEDAIVPVIEDLQAKDLKVVLSLSTPMPFRHESLQRWNPLSPEEWREILAHCPGLGLSFSAADCAWQYLDYLQILPGIVKAVEHVEANDVEINRELLAGSGLFGPLWWRYRIAGKGQIDWTQLIEALKLYDYGGSFSIQLDDEFVQENRETLEDALDVQIAKLTPLMV